MSSILSIPREEFQQVVSRLLERRREPVRLQAGTTCWDGNVELLLPAEAGERDCPVEISLADPGWHQRPPWRQPGDCAAWLLVGHGDLSGQAWGMTRRGSRLEPLRVLKLVGPGMHRVRLPEVLDGAGESSPGQPLWPHRAAGAVLERRLAERLFARLRPLENHRGISDRARMRALQADPVPAASAERWSRTIGALGEAAWQRLTHLRMAVVGLGRTGSVLARSLVGVGVRRLVLIDPDRIEPHNLGEMNGVDRRHVGLAKVDALAGTLRAEGPDHAEIVPVAESITQFQALQAAKACDVAFACVDHDSARLAVAAIATLFLKPLIAIATGIHGHGEQRELGADVRLVLPGRCLACFGGLRDAAQAAQVLASADAERRFYLERQWQAERAGSLRSLNQLAASLGLRLLEELIAERIQRSLWVRVEFDARGRLGVSYPTPPAVRDCPLCALRNRGDEALAQVPEALQKIGERSAPSAGSGPYRSL